MPPPAARPIAIIGATAVKVTPWRSGSLTPIFQKPTDWMIDAIPQVNRSALIRWIELLVGETDGPGQQDRHDDRAGVEREDVLEAVDRELARWQDLIDGVLDASPRGGFGNRCCHRNLWLGFRRVLFHDAENGFHAARRSYVEAADIVKQMRR